MIFQNPATSLNPILSVGQQLTEILRWHTGVSRQAGARPGGRAPDARGHQRSGGAAAAVSARAERRHEAARRHRPRAAVRAGLASRGRADDGARRHHPGADPRSAGDLRQRLSMSMVLVTHDMGVVARMADRITVMYAGRVCETADAARSSARPSIPTHGPCWRACRASTTATAATRRVLPSIAGRPPDLLMPRRAAAFTRAARKPPPNAAARCRASRAGAGPQRQLPAPRLAGRETP